MTSPDTPPPAVAPSAAEADTSFAAFWRGTHGPLTAALVLAAAHFAWLWVHFAPAIMSPDANGYVVQARLLAETGRTWFTTASPAQYVGMHWLETTEGVFHSRYPAGLPLLMAAAWKLGGLDAALLINPLLASATVLLVFLLARRFVGGWPALLAAAVVAAAPVTNQHALDADAHIAAAFFLVAGVLALLRFEETRSPAWGGLAGVLLGIIPTVRYPEAIVGVAVGAWLLWRVRPAWRTWPAVAGAALPLGLLFAHNAAAYGAFWRTGYALTNEQTGFGLDYFASHAVPYLHGLGGQGLSLFFAFGVAGLAALAFEPRRRAEGLLFAGITVPVVLLYMAYYFGGAGGAGGAVTGSLRFLIPTFPFFAVAGVWLLVRLAENSGRAGWAAVAVVAALQLLVAGTGSIQTLARTKTTLTAAAAARATAREEIPAGSVVIVDRQLAESLDAVGRWRVVEENLVAGAGLRGGPGGGFRPRGGPGDDADEDAPSPQQADKNRGQRERYEGLPAGERRTRLWADLAAWAGDQPIFWFARSLDQVDNALPAGADYQSVAEIDAPAMRGPGAPGGGNPMMGGPGGGRGGRGGRGALSGQNPGQFGPGGPGPGPGFAGIGGPGGRGRGPNAGAPTAKLRIVKVILP